MKLLATSLLAATLVLTTGLARAEDTTDKVDKGAKAAGSTVEHGATSVGKGASKVYHDAASDVHKVIGKNSRSKHMRRSHLSRAAVNKEKAAEKARQSERELDRAKDSADKVKNPPPNRSDE